MTDAVLALNAGSSSLKAALFPLHEGPALAQALADGIGPAGTLRLAMANGTRPDTAGADVSSHAAAVQAVLHGLIAALPGLRIHAVGHRVVHGGDSFTAPARITPDVLARIEALLPFAPLHQPHNLAGIHAAMLALPGVPQVGCFDTAFHRTHPWVHDTYALPRDMYAQGLRRYGFHGLSYDYIAGELSRIAPDIAQGRVVIAHLGNGASICALRGGQSVATTMGFTALDGLPMGTRPGRIDPGVLLYLMEQHGLTPVQLSDLLYRQSGLLGLSGLSNDMRVLLAAGTPQAEDAIAYFVTACRAEIASMAAALQGIDALVFTGGIGENAARIRQGICDGLEWMGISALPDPNARHATTLSPEGTHPRVMVIPTSEETVIARAARAAALEGPGGTAAARTCQS